MSFVIYGSDNDKKIIEAEDIHQAHDKLRSIINDWHYNNVNYKITRYWG